MASFLTLVMSVINSIASVLFSLTYNNLLIQNYGSKVNGLISTLTQFVSLFSIIEGGFTTAVVVALYKPIITSNYEELNSILYTAKRTFQKIGSEITICVLISGIVYIKLIDSPFNLLKTSLLLVISVCSTALSISYVSQYSVLLQGENKEYIIINISLFCRLFTWIISMILMINNHDIIVVYAINIINIALNILFLKAYNQNKYPYVTYKGKIDHKCISGTKDVLFQKIANTIFTSTDLVIISVFISLSSASVYNLYYQIYRAVFTLLTSIAQAPFNSFGLLANDNTKKDSLNEMFNIYQHLVLIISTVGLTVTGIIIIPFIRVYTINITDFKYVYPVLSILFFSQIYSQIINRPYGIILNVTGNFKMQNIQCGIAAVVNILASLAFIKPLGINSIILGSFIATLIILFMNIHQAYNHVLHTQAFRALINISLNYGISILLIILSYKLNIHCKNYYHVIAFALVFTLIVSSIILFLNLLIDKKSTVKVLQFVKITLINKMG